MSQRMWKTVYENGRKPNLFIRRMPVFRSWQDFQSTKSTDNKTIDLNNPYKPYSEIMNLTTVLAQIINSQQANDKNKSNMK